MNKVIKNSDMRASLVAQMERDLRGFQRKYEGLRDYIETPELFAVIDEFLNSTGPRKDSWKEYVGKPRTPPRGHSAPTHA
jgi:hypothetical protein